MGYVIAEQACARDVTYDARKDDVCFGNEIMTPSVGEGRGLIPHNEFDYAVNCDVLGRCFSNVGDLRSSSDLLKVLQSAVRGLLRHLNPGALIGHKIVSCEPERIGSVSLLLGQVVESESSIQHQASTEDRLPERRGLPHWSGWAVALIGGGICAGGTIFCIGLSGFFGGFRRALGIIGALICPFGDGDSISIERITTAHTESAAVLADFIQRSCDPHLIACCTGNHHEESDELTGIKAGQARTQN